MKALILFAAAVLISFPACAKPGDSKQVIEQRWGKPNLADDDTFQYSKGGFLLLVSYDHQVSVKEDIYKPINKDIPNSHELSQTEIDAFLKIYGDDQTWTKSEGLPHWKRDDGKVEAKYNGDMLIFTDVAYYQAMEKRDDAAIARMEARKAQDETNNIAAVFGPTATPVPTPVAAVSATSVKASQQVAARKYPELTRAGSPLNAKFLARFKQWQAAHDPRLGMDNWPEQLADDCVAHP